MDTKQLIWLIVQDVLPIEINSYNSLLYLLFIIIYIKLNNFFIFIYYNIHSMYNLILFYILFIYN